jgi:SprT protein
MPVSLSHVQQQELLHVTRHWITVAEKLHGRSFHIPEVGFDLRGQAAGQYHGGSHPHIRYNPQMAASQFDAFCTRTPAHEVAHYIVDCLYPRRSIKPHGKEWQDLMLAFGLEPSRCHQYDLQQVQQRRQRRFAYECGCQEHQLSATRHNRVRHRGLKYRCIKCGEVLQPVADS